MKRWYLPLGLALALFLTPPVVKADTPDAASPAEPAATELVEPKPTETEAAPDGETAPSAAEEAPKENAPAEETAPAIRYDQAGNQFFQGDQLLTNQWVAWNGEEYFADGAGHPYANRFITFGEGVSYLMGENGAKLKGLQAFRGDLYLLDEQTGLLRLDNAWVKTGEGEVFPNSEGKVYHDRIISFGSTEYYMNSRGTKFTGLKSIGSDLYYFDEMTGILRKDNAWVKTSLGEIFPNSEGKVYHDRIISFGSTEYYMDSQGVKSTGLKSIGSDLYYFDETTGILRKDNAWVKTSLGEIFPNSEGKVYHDRIISFGSTEYYMDSQGKKATGLKRIGSDLYYFDETTYIMRKDNAWVKTSLGEIFPNSEGKVYHDRIISFGSTRYYMDSQGVKSTGLKSIGSDLYYFDETTGILRKDNAWVKTSLGEIFPNSEGKVYHDRFLTFGPKAAYYVNSEGVLQTGIFHADGTVYRTDAQGRLIAESSSFQFEGNTYVTNEDGYTYQNVFYDVEGKKYYAGPDGARVTGYTMIDGAMWRFDSNGALVQESSAYEVNGKKYFSKPDGSPYRNQVLTFGDKAYYMGADGSRQYGLIRSGDVTYYAHTGTGELLLNAGLFTVADSTFYSGSRYALSTGLLTFGDVAYYFDPQAEYPEAVKSTTRTINGITYQFDSTGRGMRARMRWPLPGHTRISSYCGLRWGSMHAGIDIPAPIGTPILACSDGTVVYSGYDSSRGNHVIVQNEKGNCSIYMHMCRKAVSQGERVHVGQVLGYVGMTGNSTGPHLHFELRIGGARGRIVNPLIYEYDQK